MVRKKISLIGLLIIASVVTSVAANIFIVKPATAATTKAKCVTAPCTIALRTITPTAPNLQFAKIIQPKCVTYPCSEAVGLTWNTNPPEQQVHSYELYRNGALRATIPASSTLTFRDTVSGSRVTHDYSVRAISATGAADSNTVSYTTAPIIDNNAPTTPANLRAEYIEVGDMWGARLTWQPATDDIGVDRYVIIRADNTTQELRDIVVPGNQTSYTDLLYRLGTGSTINFEYFVFAIDAAGNESEYSNQALFPPGATLMANPVTVGSRYGARLSWSLPENAYPANYFVITRNGSGGEHAEFTVGGNATSYDDLLLGMETGSDASYIYQITAYDEYGNFLYTSNIVTFYSASPLSKGNKKLSNQLYTSQPRPRL